MNSIDRQLEQLLHAAARAPKTPPGDAHLPCRRTPRSVAFGGTGAGDLGHSSGRCCGGRRSALVCSCSSASPSVTGHCQRGR